MKRPRQLYLYIPLVFISFAAKAQQSDFETFMKNDTVNLKQIIRQDSVEDAKTSEMFVRLNSDKVKKQNDTLNIQLYNILMELNSTGLKRYNANQPSDSLPTTIFTTFNKDSSQLKIFTSPDVNYKTVAYKFKMKNAKKRFPQMWTMVKDKQIVFEETGRVYPAILMSQDCCDGGLTLPRVPAGFASYAAGTTEDVIYISLANKTREYIVNYISIYRCDKELISQLDRYEEKMDPKTNEHRYLVRRKFVDYLKRKCK